MQFYVSPIESQFMLNVYYSTSILRNNIAPFITYNVRFEKDAPLK